MVSVADPSGASVANSVCANISNAACSSNGGNGAGAVFGTVANTLIYIIGGIAVIMHCLLVASSMCSLMATPSGRKPLRIPSSML